MAAVRASVETELVVVVGVAVSEAICQVLHGRNPEGRPPLADVNMWEDAVESLEAEFDPTATVPQQRRGNIEETKVH